MLIVTIAALVMAASLGWFAFRLLQEEHRRSEARVALLTAALDADPPATAQVDRQPAPPLPALPRIVMLDDDSRSMRAFASERSIPPSVPHTHDGSADVLRPSVPHPDDEAAGSQARAVGLFADVPAARPADARGPIALAGVVLVGLLAVGYVWFGRADATGPATAAHAAAMTGDVQGAAVPAAKPAASAGVPLELLSLRHEQRGDTLLVRGLVRNPVSGSDRTGVQASVVLLDRSGNVLGNERADIDTARLRPGDDAGFSVRLASHEDVRRYRVTFRTAGGALIPHADGRDARP